MKAEKEQPHDGRNVKRIREILRVKQSTLAHALGEDWNQKKISQLEDKETIDDTLMAAIAGVLKVQVEAIRNFDEGSTVMIIQNNNEGTNHQAPDIDNLNNVNPVEKWLEALEENKKLYERLLQAEREKIEMLQRMLERNSNR